MDPVLARFRPLTPSQRQIGKYFLVVAGVLLLQILAGSIMAHYYSDRASFYGIADRPLPAVQFPARRAHPDADRVDRPVVDRRGACSWRRRSAAAKPSGQGLLVDVLFWVTLLVVVGALAGNYLGIMGYIGKRLVLVRQPGPVLHPARPRLADRVLCRPGRSGACWCSARCGRPRERCAQATRQFWSGRIRLEHLIWASTVNIAAALRLRHDPAHRASRSPSRSRTSGAGGWSICGSSSPSSSSLRRSAPIC